jgi:aconitate hydratase
MLLGVRAVLAESFERIHRSNLIGMGVLPLQFANGASVASLGLTGTETFDLFGLAALAASADATFRVLADDQPLPVVARLDTTSEREHYRQGGILPFVLRDLLGRSAPIG